MMQSLYSLCKSASALFLLAVCSSMATSCDGVLDDGYGECPPDVVRVKFKYDYNMKYADAFPHEVRSVDLFVFDETGKFVCRQTESGEALADGNYSMPIELKPGNYEFITWAGLENEESFTLNSRTAVTSKEDLICRMNRHDLAATPDDSVGYLKPLWHGQTGAAVPVLGHTGKVVSVEVPLVKNTNTFRILLQQLSEDPIDVKDFVFTIADKNGLMNHDNALLEDGDLLYSPYYMATGSSDVSSEGELLNMAVAELSVGRLMTDHDPHLIVTSRRDGKTVFDISLIKYLDVCRTVANYGMPLQEYLDREDEYVFHFFLDDRGRWITTQVNINGWIVRFNDINT